MLDVDLDLFVTFQGPDTAELRGAQGFVASDLSGNARALQLQAGLQEQAAGHVGAPSAAQLAGVLAREQNGSGPTSIESGRDPAQPGTLALSLAFQSQESSKGIKQRGLAAYCLGSFRLFHNQHMVSPWSSRKGLAALEYLILHHPTPVPKEVLIDVFWPNAGVEAGRRNLHQAVYAVRQVFRKHGLDPQALQFEQDHYFLDPKLGLWTDVVEFEQHVQAGRRQELLGQAKAAMAEYAIAQGLYQGDLLEDDLYDDWPRWRRQSLRNTYLDLADRLSEYYLQQQDYSAAMTVSWRILSFDHCYEQAHCRLMKCYMAQGQRHMAVRQYHLCADALQADLDLFPSEETTALYRQLVAEA